MTTTSTHRPTDHADADAVTAQGINGRISINGDRVTLHKGLRSIRSGIRGQRFVPLSQIAGVRLEPATDQTDGRLRLVMQGEDADKAIHGDGEYTIRFHPTSAASFERVRSHLDAML
jgi:hypothetical protein